MFGRQRFLSGPELKYQGDAEMTQDPPTFMVLQLPFLSQCVPSLCPVLTLHQLPVVSPLLSQTHTFNLCLYQLAFSLLACSHWASPFLLAVLSWLAYCLFQW